MSKFKRRLKRSASRLSNIIALSVLFLILVLYQKELFDFTFYNRNPEKDEVTAQTTAATPAHTEKNPNYYDNPDVPPEYSLQFEEALRAAKNISKVGAGVLKGGEPAVFEFATLTELIPEGYILSYADFDLDGTMRLCRLELDIPTPDYDVGYESQFIHFYSTAKDDFYVPEGHSKLDLESHSGVKLYMGYIITDDGYDQKIYDNTGKLIYSGSTDTLIPALTRDLNGNPLFLKYNYGKMEHCYISAEGEVLPSDYNDATDNRGLYFDYTPSYGVADNGMEKYWKEITVQTVVTAMPGEYTEEEPEEDGDTVQAEENTEAPPDDEMLYGSGGFDLLSFWDNYDEEEEEEDEDYRIPGYIYDDETTDEETTEVITEPATEPATEPVTTPAPETTEETTAETTEEVTAEPEPIIVDIIYTNEYRFAYGWNEWWRVTYFDYAKMFNFSEGYGVCFGPNKVMAVVYESGYENYRFTRDMYAFNENGRLAYTIYTEPLLKDITSIGNYYFDRGYLRVRQLDTDKYYGNPDYIIAQYDLLLDENAEVFEIPDGYDMVAYSDGVLLLTKDGFYGYYTTDHKWIAQPIYTYARPFAEGLGVIGFSNGVKGIIDTSGNVVLPFSYTEISQISTGILAAYSKSTGWEFYGKAAIDPNFVPPETAEQTEAAEETVEVTEAE